MPSPEMRLCSTDARLVSPDTRREKLSILLILGGRRPEDWRDGGGGGAFPELESEISRGDSVSCIGVEMPESGCWLSDMLNVADVGDGCTLAGLCELCGRRGGGGAGAVL